MFRDCGVIPEHGVAWSKMKLSCGYTPFYFLQMVTLLALAAVPGSFCSGIAPFRKCLRWKKIPVCEICFHKNKQNISVKTSNWERTRCQRRRWMWSISLSTDISGLHLQTQKCMQNTSWEQTGGPDLWRRRHRTTHNLIGWRNRGKDGSVGRTGPAIGWWGTWSRGPISPVGWLSQRRNI